MLHITSPVDVHIPRICHRRHVPPAYRPFDLGDGLSCSYPRWWCPVSHLSFVHGCLLQRSRERDLRSAAWSHLMWQGGQPTCGHGRRQLPLRRRRKSPSICVKESYSRSRTLVQPLWIAHELRPLYFTGPFIVYCWMVTEADEPLI